MFVFEDSRNDRDTIQKYAAFEKAYTIFKDEKPECVIYGEKANGKDIYYLEPYGASLDKLRLYTKAIAPEGRTPLALYKDQMDDIWDFLKRGYVVKAQLNLREDLKEISKTKEVEKLIDDLYELRHSSLEKDGEYGLGNLVFKELRGLGYLDLLKDLKRDLEAQELSLFSNEPLGEPNKPFDVRQAIIDNPQLIEDDVFDMQEEESEKEDNNFDENKLREGLVSRLVNQYNLTEEEATKTVDSYFMPL